MLQPQIIDYAKSQLKLGVSREAIKSALVSAGWPEADVEESLVDAEGAEKKPFDSAQGKPEPEPKVIIEPVKEVVKQSASRIFGGEERKDVISVRDLVSGANSKLEISKPVEEKKVIEAKPQEKKKEETPVSLASSSTSRSGPAASPGGPVKLDEIVKKPRFSKSVVVTAILAVVAVGFTGVAGWFYLQNQGLSIEAESFKGQAGTSAARIAELESQINNLQNNLDNLNKEKQQFALELGFFAAPSGTLAGGESAFSNLKGVLGGGGKTSYTITTVAGSQLTIKNSEVADAKLKPLLGQEVIVSGTYIPGSRQLTITEVNGSPIAPPVGE